MKKIIFGSFIACIGFIDITVIAILSVFNRQTFNGVSGLLGFLYGTDTFWYFNIGIIMFVIGLVILAFESYDITNLLKKIDRKDKQKC